METVSENYKKLKTENTNEFAICKAIGFSSPYYLQVQLQVDNLSHIISATDVITSVKFLLDNGFDIIKKEQ